MPASDTCPRARASITNGLSMRLATRATRSAISTPPGGSLELSWAETLAQTTASPQIASATFIFMFFSL
jgi:hypothetical protein